jgi:hypothetical protein
MLIRVAKKLGMRTQMRTNPLILMMFAVAQCCAVSV